MLCALVLPNDTVLVAAMTLAHWLPVWWSARQRASVLPAHAQATGHGGTVARVD
jgi:hypothetical protein